MVNLLPMTLAYRVLDAYLGVAQYDPAFGELIVSEENGSLAVRFPGAQQGDVEHWYHEVYWISWRGPSGYHRFGTSALGEPGYVEALTISDVGTFIRTLAVSR